MAYGEGYTKIIRLTSGNFGGHSEYLRFLRREFGMMHILYVLMVSYETEDYSERVLGSQGDVWRAGEGQVCIEGGRIINVTWVPKYTTVVK